MTLPVSSSHTKCRTIFASLEQTQVARGRRAVEHADEAALHVGSAAPDDPPVRPARLELRPRLRRHDVEVPVEVDRPLPRADARAQHARLLEFACRRQLDQLGRQAQPRHRLGERAATAAEPAARRVLGVDRDELLEQRGHLVGARLEPGLHIRSAGHQRLISTSSTQLLMIPAAVAIPIAAAIQ